MSHKHQWVLPSAAYLLLQLCLQSSLYGFGQGKTTVPPYTETNPNSIQDAWPSGKTKPLNPETTTTADRSAKNANSETTPESLGELLSSSPTAIVPTPRTLGNISGIIDFNSASDIITDSSSQDNFTSVLHVTLFPSESLNSLPISSATSFTAGEEPFVTQTTLFWNNSDWLSTSDHYSHSLSSYADISSTILYPTIHPTSSFDDFHSPSDIVSPSLSMISTDPSLTPTNSASSPFYTTPHVSVTVTSVHNWTMSTMPTTTNTTDPLGEGNKDPQRGDPDEPLSTPAIIGIAFGVTASVLLITGIVLFILKRRVFGQTKHDSSNYWDDNVTLSYINSHAEFPKDMEAEMMSLDDDSFLNSLDSMTFANLWATDTAKHTNF